MDNTNNQATQADNMGNDVQGNNQEGKGKLFTQDEVNGFVQSRISRMKGQLEKEARGQYEQKLAELNAREMKLLVKEKLSERNMPRELADIITCQDENDLNDKLDALNKIYGSNAKTDKSKTGFFTIGAASEDNQKLSSGQDPVRRAMGLI